MDYGLTEQRFRKLLGGDPNTLQKTYSGCQESDLGVETDFSVHFTFFWPTGQVTEANLTMIHRGTTRRTTPQYAMISPMMKLE